MTDEIDPNRIALFCSLVYLEPAERREFPCSCSLLPRYLLHQLFRPRIRPPFRLLPWAHRLSNLVGLKPFSRASASWLGMGLGTACSLDREQLRLPPSLNQILNDAINYTVNSL